jgi:hypothetical protein
MDHSSMSLLDRTCTIDTSTCIHSTLFLIFAVVHMKSSVNAVYYSHYVCVSL